jgi:cytochrome c oxidase subunit 1
MNQENLNHDLSFVRRYLVSTDHKVIAKQYLTLSLFWAVIGAATAYLIRWQIGHPDTEALGWGFIEPQVYNALVTMHGTIMVFFVAMPLLLSVLGNFLIPLMIGAKDMAFPKLNALSFWFFLLSSAILFASFFVPGGAAAAGWTGYPPLSAKNEYTGGGYGMDLWLLSLALEFASFLLGGMNFLTTTMNLRAPGLTWFRLPILVWMQLTEALIFML